MSEGHILWLLSAMILATFLTRGLPFFSRRIFRNKAFLVYLGYMLPPIMIASLLAYCVLSSASGILREILLQVACLGIVGYLQWKWAQTMMSLGAGCCLYLLCKNLLFL